MRRRPWMLRDCGATVLGGGRRPQKREAWSRGGRVAVAVAATVDGWAARGMQAVCGGGVRAPTAVSGALQRLSLSLSLFSPLFLWLLTSMVILIFVLDRGSFDSSERWFMARGEAAVVMGNGAWEKM
ncbi:Na+/H+ antiporter subunit D [Sesbania bispinosa]|nr:Na+/H+ antiporter subunit D [Sesbania bispinosa]